MKLNWAERLVVNNPVRVMIQRGIIKWIKGVTRIGGKVCGKSPGGSSPAAFTSWRSFTLFYQNFLARRIFLHPEYDRFYSHDL